MVLTDEEMKQIRLSIEEKVGLDDELLKRCGHLLHIGAFDEAVRNAFVLLEERLRKATSQEGMTGTKLANFAFNSDSSLAKQLSSEVSEREGLRELYSGAFKLFRNPTAHGIVGYDNTEGKAIINLVNLLLVILSKVEDMPSPNFLPKNAEAIILDLEKTISAGVASRLRTFISRCIKSGLEPGASAKQMIPFKRHALMKYDTWDKPRPYPFALFYLVSGVKDQTIQFPVHLYYRLVVGFDLEDLQKDLQNLGFRPVGQQKNYAVDLRLHNDQTFFEKLNELIMKTRLQIDSTLS
jgi:uncharacterized protein (TIGR02391 family)